MSTTSRGTISASSTSLNRQLVNTNGGTKKTTQKAPYSSKLSESARKKTVRTEVLRQLLGINLTLTRFEFDTHPATALPTGASLVGCSVDAPNEANRTASSTSSRSGPAAGGATARATRNVDRLSSIRRSSTIVEARPTSTKARPTLSRFDVNRIASNMKSREVPGAATSTTQQERAPALATAAQEVKRPSQTTLDIRGKLSVSATTKVQGSTQGRPSIMCAKVSQSDRTSAVHTAKDDEGVKKGGSTLLVKRRKKKQVWPAHVRRQAEKMRRLNEITKKFKYDPNMFARGTMNLQAMADIVYHILSNLAPQEVENLTSCYPAVDRVQMRQFTNIAAKIFDGLKRKGAIPPQMMIRKSFLEDTRGIRFERTLLSLTQIILRAMLQNQTETIPSKKPVQNPEELVCSLDTISKPATQAPEGVAPRRHAMLKNRERLVRLIRIKALKLQIRHHSTTFMEETRQRAAEQTKWVEMAKKCAQEKEELVRRQELLKAEIKAFRAKRLQKQEELKRTLQEMRTHAASPKRIHEIVKDTHVLNENRSVANGCILPSRSSLSPANSLGYSPSSDAGSIRSLGTHRSSIASTSPLFKSNVLDTYADKKTYERQLTAEVKRTSRDIMHWIGKKSDKLRWMEKVSKELRSSKSTTDDTSSTIKPADSAKRLARRRDILGVPSGIDMEKLATGRVDSGGQPTYEYVEIRIPMVVGRRMGNFMQEDNIRLYGGKDKASLDLVGVTKLWNRVTQYELGKVNGNLDGLTNSRKNSLEDGTRKDACALVLQFGDVPNPVDPCDKDTQDVAKWEPLVSVSKIIHHHKNTTLPRITETKSLISSKAMETQRRVAPLREKIASKAAMILTNRPGDHGAHRSTGIKVPQPTMGLLPLFTTMREGGYCVGVGTQQTEANTGRKVRFALPGYEASGPMSNDELWLDGSILSEELPTDLLAPHQQQYMADETSNNTSSLDVSSSRGIVDMLKSFGDRLRGARRRVEYAAVAVASFGKPDVKGKGKGKIPQGVTADKLLARLRSTAAFAEECMKAPPTPVAIAQVTKNVRSKVWDRLTQPLSTKQQQPKPKSGLFMSVSAPKASKEGDKPGLKGGNRLYAQFAQKLKTTTKSDEDSLSSDKKTAGASSKTKGSATPGRLQQKTPRKVGAAATPKAMPSTTKGSAKPKVVDRVYDPYAGFTYREEMKPLLCNSFGLHSPKVEEKKPLSKWEEKLQRTMTPSNISASKSTSIAKSTARATARTSTSTPSGSRGASTASSSVSAIKAKTPSRSVLQSTKKKETQPADTPQTAKSNWYTRLSTIKPKTPSSPQVPTRGSASAVRAGGKGKQILPDRRKQAGTPAATPGNKTNMSTSRSTLRAISDLQNLSAQAGPRVHQVAQGKTEKDRGDAEDLVEFKENGWVESPEIEHFGSGTLGTQPSPDLGCLRAVPLQTSPLHCAEKRSVPDEPENQPHHPQLVSTTPPSKASPLRVLDNQFGMDSRFPSPPVRPISQATTPPSQHMRTTSTSTGGRGRIDGGSASRRSGTTPSRLPLPVHVLSSASSASSKVLSQGLNDRPTTSVLSPFMSYKSPSRVGSAVQGQNLLDSVLSPLPPHLMMGQEETTNGVLEEDEEEDSIQGGGLDDDYLLDEMPPWGENALEEPSFLVDRSFVDQSYVEQSDFFIQDEELDEEPFVEGDSFNLMEI
ncbi:hypothetical protein HK102_003507 [Quaeritorhiza haematococci]|nr:hypothetical protein HK102_003507 [Quaeritorhiza haematococci]